MRSAMILAALILFCRDAGAAPVCDGRWQWLPVAGTRCLDGSTSGFIYICQASEGAAGPLFVFLDGGGACWDGASCDCRPCLAGDTRALCACVTPGLCPSSDVAPGGTSLIGQDTALYLLPSVGASWLDDASIMHGYTMVDGEGSPFGPTWNYAYIPYCTGDVHSGNATQTYTTKDHRGGYTCATDSDCRDPLSGAPGPAGSCDAGLCRDVTFTVHHRGYVDDTQIIGRIKGLFPAPSRVAASGISAGGYGLDCNLSQVRGAWPSVPMYSLSSASPALFPTYAPDLDADVSSWGAFRKNGAGRYVSRTCPAASPSGVITSWAPSNWVYWNEINLPDVRKAAAISRLDNTVGFFSCQFGATPDAAGLCEWSVADSIADFIDGYLDPDASYKIFEADSECHGYDGDDDADSTCSYSLMNQNGVQYSDWVNAWMQAPSPVEWQNVLVPERVPIP